jgi:hypothetical protein
MKKSEQDEINRLQPGGPGVRCAIAALGKAGNLLKSTQVSPYPQAACRGKTLLSMRMKWWVIVCL